MTGGFLTIAKASLHPWMAERTAMRQLNADRADKGRYFSLKNAKQRGFGPYIVRLRVNFLGRKKPVFTALNGLKVSSYSLYFEYTKLLCQSPQFQSRWHLYCNA